MADEHLKAVISGDASQLNGELDKSKAKVKEVESASTSATSKGAEGWKALSQGILKAGSSMAIIAKGVESLINIFRQLREAATEAVLAMAKTLTGNQREASERNYNRATGAQQALREYWEAWHRNEAEPSNEGEARLQQMRRDFRRRYGDFQVDLTASDMEGELRHGLEDAQKRRIKAIEAEIEGIEKANEKLDERQGRLTNLDKRGVEALQAEKNLNDARLRALTEQLHNLKNEDPTNGIFGIAKAQDRDRAEREAAEAAKQREADAAKLAKEREQREREYLAALKSYKDATRRVGEAVEELARTSAQLARERRADAISARRERLQRRMSRYRFTPFEGFSVDETGAQRAERRRNYRLDESIAGKLARQETGERVHYSQLERNRLAEYQRLERRDKAAEAAQRQMEAADKQAQAAETMGRAVNALAEARGVRGFAAANYSQSLALLHGDLQALLRGAYIVR